MYSVAGYWFLENPSLINRSRAEKIRVLKNAHGGIVDATEIVAYYLQTLPNKTVNPSMNRIRLLKPLPQPISENKEIQPLHGATRINW